MPVPDYQTLMLPLLQHAADEAEHASSEPLDYLASRFGLSNEERQARMPSGINMLYDRMHWSLSYLRQAGLLKKHSSRLLPTDRARALGARIKSYTSGQ